MSTTITDNPVSNIFECSDKLRQHSKQYEKCYSAPDVVEHLRNNLFNLAKLLELDSFIDIKSSSSNIEENFRLVNKDLTMTMSFNSYGHSTPYPSFVKNPCTFLQYNKHLASLGHDIVSESKTAILDFLNSLTYLHRRDYSFNCDYDEGCFDIRFESRKSRFNVEVGITLN